MTYLSFLQRLSIRWTTNLNKQSSRAKGRTFQEITPTNEFLQLATWPNFETFYTETSTYFKTLWHGRKSQFFFFIGRMLINQNLVILRKKVFMEKGSQLVYANLKKPLNHSVKSLLTRSSNSKHFT